MPTRFHHTKIWKEITASARKQRGFVAAAYVGKAGYKLLPLRSGSILVTDFSEEAIKSGQTCPDAILSFIRHGVRVHSWKGLHAKVFSFRSRAFVGSTNVSKHSASYLQEAALEVSDRATIASTRNFVLSLKGDEVTLEQAKRMRPLFKPGRLRTITTAKQRPQSAIWAVPLVFEDYDPRVQDKDKVATPKARRRMTSSRWFELDRFHWEKGSFATQVEEDQRVLMATKNHNGNVWLSPISRVVYVTRFRLDGKPNALVYLELRRNSPTRNLRVAKKRLGNLGRRLGKLRSPVRLSKSTDVYSLSQLW